MQEADRDTASMSSRARFVAGAASAASSSATRTLPARLDTLAAPANRKSRGTSGGGCHHKDVVLLEAVLVGDLDKSRKPSVTNSAVFAPLRSMIALVASVVPWMMVRRSVATRPLTLKNDGRCRS